jgi:hypothetical protein
VTVDRKRRGGGGVHIVLHCYEIPNLTHFIIIDQFITFGDENSSVWEVHVVGL